MTSSKPAPDAPARYPVDPIPSKQLEEEAVTAEVDITEALAGAGGDTHLPASESGLNKNASGEQRPAGSGIPLPPPD